MDDSRRGRRGLLFAAATPRAAIPSKWDRSTSISQLRPNGDSTQSWLTITPSGQLVSDRPVVPEGPPTERGEQDRIPTQPLDVIDEFRQVLSRRLGRSDLLIIYKGGKHVSRVISLPAELGSRTRTRLRTRTKTDCARIAESRTPLFPSRSVP